MSLPTLFLHQICGAASQYSTYEKSLSLLNTTNLQQTTLKTSNLNKRGYRIEMKILCQNGNVLKSRPSICAYYTSYTVLVFLQRSK